MGINRYHPLLAQGEATVTGSLRVKTGHQEKVVFAAASIQGSGAPDAHVTSIVRHDDGDITIHCWNHGESGLEAATDPVEVNWVAIQG